MESINESVSFHSLIESHIEELCNGSGKLCISPFLLSHINEALDILKNNGRSSPVEIPYELKIVLFNLEHVLKVITKLKVNQRNIATFSGPFNLKLCSSLKDAEFNKISLDNVQGFDSETNEICCISCVRCMNVFDLFTTDVWSHLKNLTLSYCQLNKIDSTILGHLRNVERLNLSFNNLKSLQDLDSLTKLVLLDISYNYLEEVPCFSEESNKSLTELYMSHNNFTSLNGLKKLIDLNYLDASDNCIYDKESLVDLYYLKQLKWLKLSNNPLSFRKHYRMYVSHFLGTIQPPFQFLLDEVHLKDAEIDFMGSSRGIVCSQRPPQQPTTSTLQPEVAVSSEVVQQAKGILKNSNRKGRKGREVVIVDAVGDPGRTPASLNTKKTGVVLQETVTLNAKPSSYGEVTNNHETDPNNSKPKDDKPLESETKPGNNINELEIHDKEVIINDIINQTMKHSYHSEIHSSPESTQAECQTVEVTVHASHDCDHNSESTNETSTELITTTENIHNLNDEIKAIDINDIRILESIDLILQNETSHLNIHSNTDSNDEFLDATSNDNDVSSEFVTDDNTNNNNNRDSTIVDNNVSNVSKDSSNSDDSAYEDDLDGDENLWPVQKLVENSKPVNMFLVLLDTELRERSTISGRTIATMPLAFIQSCTQINDDPITVELVFSSLLKHTTVRTYIMEFADAQTLMNKMNVFLASRPDVVEEQLTSFLCKSCNAFFSVYKTQARTLCSVCGSSLVTEMETGLAVTVDEHSNSSSQSSEVSTSLGGIETKTSNNNITNPSSVSTVSSDPSEKLVCNFPATSTPQKYESDVEIISNPSQSSIEILDDRSTPSRKRSSEERHVIIASTLSPLVEVNNSNLSSINETSAPPTSESEISSEKITCQPLKDESDTILISDTTDSPSCDQPSLKEGLNNPMMTESSSSGSVLTSYEANGAGLNTTMSTSTTYDIPEVSTTDTSHEADNISTTEVINEEVAEEMRADIYSYTDFTDVDHRVKAFLYQYVFNDDSEELNLLVRCHLWKTGGTDYPACFVLSNRKMYILMHTSTEHGLDASDWLKLQESHELKSIKKIYPLIWHLGVGFQINRLSYFILLFDKMYTDNLLSFVKSISLKGCDIGSKFSSKVALSLQQVVLTSNFVHDVIDPTILLYTVCLKINILTDDDAEETMTLGGFVMTPNEFYVVLGDFGWLGGSGDVPSIHFFQMMNHLIEIRQKGNVVSLHFLDETEAVEVVWYLHCFNHGHVSSIIDTMRVPWETVFNEPLQVN